MTKTTKSSPKRHCSNCGRTGHSKNKCPRNRRTKKVNNTHIVDYEESESDEETDEETEEELTEEEEEEDEPQNCFSVKKKNSSMWSFGKNQREEIPYFQV